MFNKTYLVKRTFIEDSDRNNPCVACEHGHEQACQECPLKKPEGKAKPMPKFYEGKLVIASGEDAHAFA